MQGDANILCNWIAVNITKTNIQNILLKYFAVPIMRRIFVSQNTNDMTQTTLTTKKVINGILVEVDAINCIAFYKKSVNEVNSKFYEVIEGVVEKEDNNSYLATFIDGWGNVCEKFFNKSSDAQKYIFSKFEKEIKYYQNFK